MVVVFCIGIKAVSLGSLYSVDKRGAFGIVVLDIKDIENGLYRKY